MKYGVDFEAVAAAVQQLNSQGIRPSLRAVREALGNTGSLTTIQAHLARYNASVPASAPAPQVSLSTEITRVILAELSKREADVRKTLEVDLTEARETIALLTKENGEIQSELERARTAAIEFAQHRDKAQGKVETLESEIERLRREFSSLQAEGMRDQVALAVAQTSASELTKTNDTLRQLIATLRLPAS
jgi:uncharacterized phage infection (PIP) family protein YhgE